MNDRGKSHTPLARKKIYLETIPAEEALNRLEALLSANGWFEVRPAETVSSYDACGRISAGPVFANASSPHYPASAMDGLAVRSAGLSGASEKTPVTLMLEREAVIVDTGDPIPDGYDAVVMWEELVAVDSQSATVIKAVAPWQHVRMVGEDVVENEMLFPGLHRFGAADVGALLAGGILEVSVLKTPVVGLIPSGPELVAPGRAEKPGDIPEYNSAMLSAFIRQWGGCPRVYEPVADEPGKIAEVLLISSRECDLVCLMAGSSAGRDDWASTAIGQAGHVLVHGVATRPGKPVILGIIGNKPVIGLPGYPVSAAVALERFIRPLLTRRNAQIPSEPVTVQAVFGRRIESPAGLDETIQVRLGPVDDRLIALPLSRGAGVVSALSRADGRIVVPRGQTGLEPGQLVEVFLYREPQEVRRQILLAGSHDLTLDVLNSWLKKRYPPLTLASAPLGSLGGLMALRRGEALIAGSHLLDPETGEYNISYVRQYLAGQAMLGISLVQRQQGLMVKKGNPLGLQNLSDLTRSEVRFINRQRGSGTRVFLDWLLSQKGIGPEAIPGYDTEEYTHLAVAAAVASGAADTGMGIYAAAQALRLDFIPLAMEQYDLIVPVRFMDHDLILELRETINQEQFQQEVRALGGYATEGTGEVRWQT